MGKYPPESLEPENLAECIDDLGKKISQLENTLINDEQVSVYAILERLDRVEKQLKVVSELHLRAIEENTWAIGKIIEIHKPGRFTRWLGKIKFLGEIL